MGIFKPEELDDEKESKENVERVSANKSGVAALQAKIDRLEQMAFLRGFCLGIEKSIEVTQDSVANEGYRKGLLRCLTMMLQPEVAMRHCKLEYEKWAMMGKKITAKNETKQSCFDEKKIVMP